MDNLIVFSSTRKNINIDNMCHMETTVAPSCTRISTHLLRQCKLCMFWRHKHIKYERVCTDTMSSKDAIMKVLYIDVYLNTYWPHNDVDYQSDIYEKINNQRYIKNLQHYLLKSADILFVLFSFYWFLIKSIAWKVCHVQCICPDTGWKINRLPSCTGDTNHIVWTRSQ